MPDLKHWQSKIQEKRKQTNFRDFLMEIASFFPLVLYKNQGHICRYPETERIFKFCSSKEFVDSMGENDRLGSEYKFEKNFFENYRALTDQVHFPYVWHFSDTHNSEYCDTVGFCKDCYLTLCAGMGIEKIAYSTYVISDCNNILSCFGVTHNCEHVYFSLGISKSSTVFYSKYITGSNNIWFSSNLVGCSECIFCDGLENQKYMISNQQYSKEEYQVKKDEILKNQHRFLEYYRGVNTISKNIGSTQVKGNSIVDSHDVENGFFVNQVNHGRNLIIVGNGDEVEHSYDNVSSATQSTHSYGNMGCSPGSHIYTSLNSGDIHNIFYSNYLLDCSFCIGCIGLKNKSYCILNKQYSKEQWYKMADQIFASMEEQGTLGDFFPGELNPFYFNDTMAGLLGDFTKQEVEAKGYMWRDEEIKVDIPEGSEVITTSDLKNYQGYSPDGEWKINPEILQKVIIDEKGNYYRIVQMEYDFLVKHALPLPEIHWMDRMKLNFGV